ncbi:MAG: DUF1295 domain-containing protein [Myxococcales bacterium]|nr:MAG: DUF1295 domain-containing protein [Myxococcales bacterium]
MTESSLYNFVLIAWVAAAALTIPYLLFVAAPYGRHARPGWGPTIDNRLGWILMELPSPLLVTALFFVGPHNGGAAAVFLGLWLFHYLHRSLIFPLRIRSGKKAMPAAIMGSAIFFNLINASMQGQWLFNLSGGYAAAWLLDWRFLAGAAIFFVGFAINYHSDGILRNLRRPGESGYRIPQGGLFRYVTCPNYLGEVIEWCGWALATWSLAGAAFAFWTIANLIPRALAHHRWYHKKFSDYPAARKAVIPGLL